MENSVSLPSLLRASRWIDDDLIVRFSDVLQEMVRAALIVTAFALLNTLLVAEETFEPHPNSVVGDF